jgi:putative transposase
LKGVWVPHDTRDQIVDFVHCWSSKTGIAVLSFLLWVGLATSKWHNWKSRYGKVNEHNAWVPRDHWLDEAEKTAIVAFHEQHPLEGYRRLAFMMLDADVVAAPPSSVYRVLKKAGVLERHNTKPSLKGTGFVQPLRPHEHWHGDVSYLNIAGTFYFLCSILDGCSRYIVHWEIRERGGGNDYSAGPGEVPGGDAPDHLGQWAAVHRQGFQGVHPDLWHDAREDVSLLSSE